MTGPLRITSSHNPKPGDAVFIPGGTVHTLGDDVVVFEVQQNSDTTFRLYDWGHIDPVTEEPRPLQTDQAFACIEFGASDSGLVAPLVETTTPVKRERLFDCHAFLLWRVLGQEPFTVGAKAEPRVLVGIEGSGQIMHDGIPYAFGKGDVWLLPAEAGECVFQPRGEIAPAGNRDPLMVEENHLSNKISDWETNEKAHRVRFGRDSRASKSSLAPQTAGLLRDLLDIIKVAVISGGAWAQFEKQLLTDLPQDSLLANLSLLPTCGTKFFQYNGTWEELYSEDLTAEEKRRFVTLWIRRLETRAIAPRRFGEM